MTTATLEDATDVLVKNKERSQSLDYVDIVSCKSVYFPYE